jgi:hypothetical protein
MLMLLLAASIAAPPGSDWKFVDESKRDGRSVVTFRTVVLSGTPSRPLHPDDKPPQGARFGSVGIGPGGLCRLGIVWDAATSSLWFDADGDGRYSASERVTLGDKPQEAVVSVPFEKGVTQRRTVMIRKRGDGLAWAVRGYAIGSLVIGGKTIGAMLTDGDANGCFDDFGSDRIWLDLDGDGKFDPLTEQFPLGTTIQIGGSPILIRPRPDGLAATVRERPNETGRLSVQIKNLVKMDLLEFSASFVSEFGEVVAIQDASQPVAAPIGKYRMQWVSFKILDANNRIWSYVFVNSGGDFDVEVTKGRDVIHKPLETVKVSISHDAGSGVSPGQSVTIRPDVTCGALFLNKCEESAPFASSGREAGALVEIVDSGGHVLEVVSSGFA